MTLFGLWLFLASFSLVLAKSSTGSRLLVVVDDENEKAKYSTLWGDLEDRGFHSTFENAKSSNLGLFQHGERTFDHVMLLPTQAKGYGPALTPKLLLQFLNHNGNILLALGGGTSIPAAISSMLLEFGISTPPDRTAVVVDHFSHDTSSAAEDHDVVLLSRPDSSEQSQSTALFGGSGDLVFPRAIPQELSNTSPLLAPVVTAKATSYTFNAKDKDDSDDGNAEPWGSGEQMALVSAMQARNSARLLVFGSIEALQNQWLEADLSTSSSVKSTNPQNANREFARQATAWTFQETGVLRVGSIQHHLSKIEKDAQGQEIVSQDGFLNPSLYRIKNDVTVNLEVSEYKMDNYVPYIPNAPDAMQIECTMLSPFQRLDLAPSSQTQNSTIMSRSFRLPDQHGIFRFQVDYKRPFLTNVDVRTEVTVRHFAHDEWPRSWEISAGWVWVAGIWTTVAGWLAFVALWLWSAPVRTIGTKKQQ